MKTNGINYSGSILTHLAVKETALTNDERINLISKHFKQIMLILGLDLEDESLQGTPDRVARMYVNELFSGLNNHEKPEATLFENRFGYNEMIIEKNITIYSYCEHHFVPFFGKAHVAYYPGERVIGLSKINRIVQYYCKKPQVQERLTEEVARALKEALLTEDVAIQIDASRLCVMARA
jgi:GTP cyclohydrolase IA